MNSLPSAISPGQTGALHISPSRIKTKNRGQMQANGDEIFQLSDTGSQIVPLYIWMADIFPLQDNTPKTHDSVIDWLRKGLDQALGDYPELTGTLHQDNEARRIVIKRTSIGDVPLHIVDGSNELPSFQWYHSHDYPPQQLKKESLIPPEGRLGVMAIAPDLSTSGPRVAAFQVTLINGGVVVASAISHQVVDGMGWDSFFTTWAAYSKAHAMGDPEAHGLDPEIPPHTLFTAERKPSLEEWERLRGKYPTMRHNEAPPSPPPEDFQQPVVKTRIFHFPRSKVQALKAECSRDLPAEVPFISSFDAIAALWWRACLRAKLPVQPEISAPGATTNNIHAVNMRPRCGKPISQRFIGSCVALPRSRDVLASEALGDRAVALPLLAAVVRTNTAAVTPEYCRGQMLWAAGAPDLRFNDLDMPWFNGKTCMGFAWHNMQPYEKHDFGFGLPTGFRWPEMGFESFFFLFPSRAAARARMGETDLYPDEGLEVTFGMEESCFARLEKDEELLQFCEQRGMCD
ncbi:hypothetical protein MCOR25_003508 [Pyricularia grisea]|nr:hypothetical protein MCOR25_003508 [Pyricularia grisea]